jgi:hypothetical protein
MDRATLSASVRSLLRRGQVAADLVDHNAVLSLALVPPLNGEQYNLYDRGDLFSILMVRCATTVELFDYRVNAVGIGKITHAVRSLIRQLKALHNLPVRAPKLENA